MINTIDNNGAIIVEQTINGTFGEITLRYVSADEMEMDLGDSRHGYMAGMRFPGSALRNWAEGRTAEAAVRNLYAAYADSVATQDGIGY